MKSYKLNLSMLLLVLFCSSKCFANSTNWNELLSETTNTAQAVQDNKRAIWIFENAIDLGIKKYGQDNKSLSLMYFRLGQLYDKVFETNKAIENYEKSLSLKDKKTDVELLNVLLALANDYQANLDWAKAEKIYNQARNVSEELYGVNDLNTAHILSYLAFLNGRENKAEISNGYIQRTESILDKTEKYDINASQSYANILQTYLDLEDYENAKTVIEKKVKRDEEKLKLSDLDRLNNSYYLAYVYQSLGDVKRAESFYNALIKQLSKLQDSDLFPYVNVLSTYADFLENQGKREEARKYYQKVVTTLIRVSDENNVVLTQSMQSLADSYQKDGKYFEASLIHEKLINSYEKINKSDDEEVALNCVNLSQDYTGMSRYSDAIKLCERAISFYEKSPSEYAKTLDDVLFLLARNYCQNGQYDLAKYNFEKELGVQKKYNIIPAFTPEYEILRWYGSTLALMGSYQKAEIYLNQSIDLMENDSTSDKKNLLYVFDLLLSSCESIENNAPEVEKVYLRKLAALEKYCGKNNDLTIHCLVDLGDFYSQNKDESNAKKYYERVLKLIGANGKYKDMHKQIMEHLKTKTSAA